MAALDVLEKIDVDVGMEAAFICFATLPTCASWASLSNVAIFPSFSRPHLLERVAAAKLP
jgi:hypothetical protein